MKWKQKIIMIKSKNRLDMKTANANQETTRTPRTGRPHTKKKERRKPAASSNATQREGSRREISRC